MNVPNQVEAEATLADARTARATLAAGGNWLRTYLLVFAAASVPLLLLAGMGRLRGALIATVLWLLLCTVISWWGLRQRVVLRGAKGRSALAFVGWGVLNQAALMLGVQLDTRQPAFWVPAALITILPLILVACWPSSHNDQSGPSAPTP